MITRGGKVSRVPTAQIRPEQSYIKRPTQQRDRRVSREIQ